MTDRSEDTRILASAPGKLVLSGEYAVLDGAPAICMAVDRRACVTISVTGQDHHTVAAPGFSRELGRFRDSDGELEWLAAGEDYALVDDVWRTAKARPSTGLAFTLDTSEFRDATSGIKLGIGSSASLTAALTAALCELIETDVDVSSVAIAAHRQFQGGYGSGMDVACSCAGGVIEYSMVDATCLQLTWPDGLVYALLWSGVAADTGSRLERLDKHVARPSRATLARSAQRVAESWRQGSAEDILGELRDYTKVLREFSQDHELGVFDAGHAELADAAEAAGLVYKPCGAGGGDVGIVFADNPQAVAAFADNAVTSNFRALKMNIDPRGVQVVREKR